MKNKTAAAAFLAIGIVAFGQINMADSTVQVITYWEKGEKQNYTITKKQIKLDKTDTLSINLTTYDVEITVIRGTKKSYTIQWLYKNTVTNNYNPIFQRVTNAIKGLKVIYKTDELGVFIELVNWKQIQKDIQKSINILRKEYKDIPEIDNVIEQIIATFLTKEAIESTSIKDIQQFHTFHGGKYKLGEILQDELKVPNIFGGNPFDADITICLDEINEEDNNFTLKITQEISNEQLVNAFWGFYTKMRKNMNTTPPKRGDLEDLKLDMQIVSTIQGTGWVICSNRTTTVLFDYITTIEELKIEIK